MIEIYRQVDARTCEKIQRWLESEIASSLRPVRLRPGVSISDIVRHRLAEAIDWTYDYALVTYSGDATPIGITPHRDARYADYEAVGLNVSSTCEFRYWEGRQSFGKSRSVVEHTPSVDPPTHTLKLQPGDCVRFNCKNFHSASPFADRWNINFWRARK